MLNHFSNQASGLIGLGCQSGPRLVAMVSHGDERAELPLLWQLCLALVNFGYSVTVLDATTPESDSNPGLAQLLENTHWGDNDLCDAPAWTVLPCAKGIGTLIQRSGTNFGNLHQLGTLLPAEGIAILYCQVEWMVGLIGDWHVEPLLAVSPSKTSLLTGYMALKRLLITGKLKPTIVNMLQRPNFSVAARQSPASAGLSECAKRFLGHELKALNITEQQGDLAPCEEIQRLALRLLESSVSLAAEFAVKDVMGRSTPKGHFAQSAQFAGSH